jgi:hypothetical protein
MLQDVYDRLVDKQLPFMPHKAHSTLVVTLILRARDSGVMEILTLFIMLHYMIKMLECDVLQV